MFKRAETDRNQAIRIASSTRAMSGFDAQKVNATFFPDGQVKVNFLCCLGDGDAGKLAGRLPRLAFDDACTLL